MFYTYGQLDHYAIDCLDPMKTCSYYKGQDHNVEQCPQLITKWQLRTISAPNRPPNPNLNANANVHMIVAEPFDLNIAILTRGGVTTVA